MSKCVQEFVVEYNHADMLKIAEALRSVLAGMVKESLVREHGWSPEDLEGLEVRSPRFDEGVIADGAKVHVSLPVKPPKPEKGEVDG